MLYFSEIWIGNIDNHHDQLVVNTDIVWLVNKQLITLYWMTTRGFHKNTFWKLLWHCVDSWSWGQQKLMLENVICPNMFSLLRTGTPPTSHCKYGSWATYLGAANMVMWGIPEIFTLTLCQQDPQSKVTTKSHFCRISKGDGESSSKGRRPFWAKHIF